MFCDSVDGWLVVTIVIVSRDYAGGGKLTRIQHEKLTWYLYIMVSKVIQISKGIMVESMKGLLGMINLPFIINQLPS